MRPGDVATSWTRRNRAVSTALVAGVGLTVVVSLLPFVHFAYDNPSLHLALETAEGVIAGLLAFLAVKRFRASRRMQHLALACSFSTLAGVNLLLSALPIVLGRARQSGVWTWQAAGLRLVAVSLLAVSAFAGRRRVPQGRSVGRGLTAAAAAVLVVVAALAMAADAWLAEAVDPSVSPKDLSFPRLVGHPVVLGIQVAALALYAVAAVGFTRDAADEDDEMLRWLGAGSVLGAFARLNYFLFPSLYSNWVYTGDLLRLGSYLFFLVGAAREIDAYWRGQTQLAVVEERRRVARELHDGLAQELAFIRSQTAAMAAGMEVPGMIDHVAAAADRAIAESRRAIDALADDADVPLAHAVRAAAEEVADRVGAKVGVFASHVPAVPPSVHEAYVRIVREAVTNAVKHGEAGSVTVRLLSADGCLRLEVVDDGRGFDPGAVRRGFGLRSMRERVEALGGELRLSSSPGAGAKVEVLAPYPRASGRGNGRTGD